MRIEWVDPRLTWNPEEYDNLTNAWFWIGDGGSGGETSEIWTPGTLYVFVRLIFFVCVHVHLY